MDRDQLLQFIQSMGPGAEDRVRQGFARRTELPPDQEKQYQMDMHQYGLSKYIHDDTYDNRAAWLAHALPNRIKDPNQHGQSTFKGLGDDRLELPLGPNNAMVDTRNMKPVDPRMTSLWQTISRLMNQ